MTEETDYIVFDTAGKADKTNLLKRARSKYLSNGLMFGLLDLETPMKKAYWQTYHCSNNLEVSGSEVHSRFCKNRFCVQCNRIRTALLIRQYTPELRTWKNKRFITLTFPNVKASELPGALKGMVKHFHNIKEVFRRKKIEFKGLRKLEVTWNSKEDTYHPHFHVIIEGKEQASELLEQWLIRYPEATRDAQNIKEADDNSVVELFKYFTKLLTSKTEKKGNEQSEYKRKIDLKSLDIIFRSIKGMRTIQNFGFKLPPLEEEKPPEEVKTGEKQPPERWVWKNELHDWVNTKTGELLTGFQPGEGLKKIVESINDSG